jgi:hypothetical protein
MLLQGFNMLKSFIKGSLDNYILPGTLSGTEILWIYVVQWKRDFFTVTFAVLYFACSQFEVVVQDKVLSGTRTNPEQNIH